MVETVLDFKKKNLFVKWLILRLHYIILNFSLVLLLVFQVVTGEAHIAHYAKSSLLVEYRLTYPKAHKVAIGQTFVKSQSWMLTSSHFWESAVFYLLNMRRRLARAAIMGYLYQMLHFAGDWEPPRVLVPHFAWQLNRLRYNLCPIFSVLKAVGFFIFSLTLLSPSPVLHYLC